MSNGGTVVIGAGPAGLATAAELRRRGVAAVVLERADAVGSSWRGRYDRLRLNTSRWFSKLPGGSYAPGTGVFPTRDEVVSYLEDYARDNALDVRLGTRVERIDPDGAGGPCARPPATSRRARGRRGRLRAHAVRARLARPGPFPRRAAARGRLPQPRALPRPRRARGRPGLLGHGDRLRPRRGRGAKRCAWRCARRRTSSSASRSARPGALCSCASPASGDRVVTVRRRKGRRPDRVRPADPAGGRLQPPAAPGRRADDRRHGGHRGHPRASDRDRRAVEGSTRPAGPRRRRAMEPDAVIAATGYRSGLEPLVGHLGVLDAHGVPRVPRRGACPACASSATPAPGAAPPRRARAARGEGDRRRSVRSARAGAGGRREALGSPA